MTPNVRIQEWPAEQPPTGSVFGSLVRDARAAQFPLSVPPPACCCCELRAASTDHANPFIHPPDSFHARWSGFFALWMGCSVACLLFPPSPDRPRKTNPQPPTPALTVLSNYVPVVCLSVRCQPFFFYLVVFFLLLCPLAPKCAACRRPPVWDHGPAAAAS